MTAATYKMHLRSTFALIAQVGVTFIFLTFKIYHYFASLVNRNVPNTRRDQFSHFQTISPLVLGCGPVVVLCLSALTGVDFYGTRTLGTAFVVVLAAHPLANALATLTFVGPYRQIIVDLLCCCVSRQPKKRTDAKTPVSSINAAIA